MDQYRNYDDDFFREETPWDSAYDENVFEEDSFEDFEEDPEQVIGRLRDEIREGRLQQREELVAVLFRWGWMLSGKNRSEQAVQCFDETIGLCEGLIEEGRVEFRSTLAKAKLQRALEILSRGDDAAATPVDLMKAVAMLEKIVEQGDHCCRNDLAIASMFLGDYLCSKLHSNSAALSHIERAVEIWDTLVCEGETESRRSLAFAFRTKGDILREIGDKKASEEAFEIALGIFRDLRDEEEGFPQQEHRIEYLRCFIHYAESLAHFRDFIRAHVLFDDAIAYCRTLSLPLPRAVRGWLPSLLVDKARLFRDSWEFAAALKSYEEAIVEFERIRFARLCNDETFENPSECSPEEDSEIQWEDFIDHQIAHVHTNRGCLLHDLDRFEDSRSAFELAEEYYRNMERRGATDVRIDRCLVRLNYAKILVDSRRHDEAIEVQERSIEQLRSFIEEGRPNLRSNLAQALREIGLSLHFIGRGEAAREKFDQSVAMWREIIDESAVEKREQLAHSLLVRSDFLMERECFQEALCGYLESLRIRKELLEEGDWLVALPLVRTLFSAAKASHSLGNYQQSLDWSVQSLKILEQIREKGIIDVDDYILEGTRRCLGILLDMENPDAVLEELEKAFRFVEQIQAEGKTNALIETEIPHFIMYRAHAWGMKKEYQKEIQYDREAIRCWENLLRKTDRNTENPKIRTRRIDILSELCHSFSFLARACDQIGDHEAELSVYHRVREILEELSGLGTPPAPEDRIANDVRIAITLSQLDRNEEAERQYRDVLEGFGPLEKARGFPVDAEGNPRFAKMMLWCFPHYSQFLADCGRFEEAIGPMKTAVNLLKYMIESGESSEQWCSLLLIRQQSLSSFYHERSRISESLSVLVDAVGFAKKQIEKLRNAETECSSELIEVLKIYSSLLVYCADDLRILGRLDEAVQSLEQSREVLVELFAREVDCRIFLAVLNRLWGLVLYEKEDFDSALEKYQATAEILQEMDPEHYESSPLYASSRIGIGSILLKKGRPEITDRLFEEVFRFLDLQKSFPDFPDGFVYGNSAGHFDELKFLFANQAELFFQLGKTEDARHRIEKALEILRNLISRGQSQWKSHLEQVLRLQRELNERICSG